MEIAPPVTALAPPALFVFTGDWDTYEAALFTIFNDSLLNNPQLFRGAPVRVKHHPEYKGKHFAFWHLITEGDDEETRTPDMRRCERLAWVAWAIAQCDTHPEIVWWENMRGPMRHYVIWHKTEHYVVILAERQGYYLLKTHYIAEPHRRAGFEREYLAATVKKV